MLTVLVLLLGFDTFSTVKNERENRKRAHESRVLAERTLVLAERNCRNNGKLAAIERAFIGRTEGQTQALLKSGVTFGIPSDQLPALIEASQKSQARFLGDLDKLRTENCTSSEVQGRIVKPRKKKGAAKGHAHTTGTRGTLAPSATTPGRQAPSKATPPRARANPLPVRTRAPTRSAAAPTQAAGGGASTTAPVSTPSSPPPTGPAPPPTLPPPGKPPVTIRLPCVETPVVSVC